MVIFGMHITMTIVWLILAVIFLVVEGLTVGLVTIWFAAGAFAALLVSFLHASVPVQIGVFLVVSLCLLAFTRKIFVGKLRTGSKKTNVDSLVGQEGLVTAAIRPFAPGQVKAGGQMWTAAAEGGEVIEEGTTVRVVSISGVKLIVTPLAGQAGQPEQAGQTGPAE